jgi:selenocysteine lyase/cysteine desulfurase
MLCGTGRKYLRGPRGTGFLYINKDRLEELEPVFIDLHSAQWTDAGNYSLRADARRFENWEQFIAGKIGLGVAVNYALEIELPFIRSRIEELVTHFRNRASAVQGIRILEQSSAPSGIITFIKQGASANVLQKKFRSNKMNISVSKQANAQLDLGRNKLGDINRVSLHYYNTAQEIDQFIELLGTL